MNSSDCEEDSASDFCNGDTFFGTPCDSLAPDVKKLIANAKIMIVDDSAFSCAFIREVLKRSGFKNILTIESGAEALEKTESFRPDIVILDLVMDGVDGFEYCRIIRAKSAFEHMRILVQSGLKSPEQISQAFKDGASDFLAKPINPDEIVSRVCMHLKNRAIALDFEEYKKRVDAELEGACRMQQSILPSKDELSEIEESYSLDISCCFEPSSELGGDFWGVRELSHSELAIYSVDFSGHGIAAALNTFRIHTILNDNRNFYSSPELFLSKINANFINLLETGQFATMFYGVIDIDENRMQYANAGVLPPVFIPSSGEISLLELGGLPLGISKEAIYETQEISFKPSDMVILYSDALLETENEAGDYITEKELKAVLKTSNTKSSKDTLSALLKNLQKHIGKEIEKNLSDDLTINVYRRK